MKKVLFISSTGGHFEELMKLEPIMKKYDSYIATEKIKSNPNWKFVGIYADEGINGTQAKKRPSFYE